MNQSERTVPDVESLPSYQQERRQRIVDVTLDLLLKNAGAVEVRDVVDAADVSLATIYRYFGSKEVLFSAAYLHWHSGYIAALEASMKRARTNSARMRAGMGVFCDVFEQAPHMWDAYLVTRALKQPAILTMRLDFEQRLRQLFIGALHGVPERDAEGIISILTAVTAWNLSSWRTGDITTQQLRDELNEGVRLTIEGR
ncbi:MAG TPA: TetR/AcrR family transcriptional regulator [Comamonadaceae bacterium]|jgi:AcrR family transcriptional regulator|uniref:TetR/AcrR family transcriptional regulator n=1 Tax=unclassified Acidovorax TaxID=2684926 RepID=UPI0008CE4B67|nr:MULTISPECIES: TetR/AcrR family transcriptional regulator [unclassified Acidovorax]MCL4769328.1 TetR/AcrR family transcriptional regulator [Burkholderiaceae bacterium]OGB00774.1 MAG: hypothetical protein A2Z55_06475 [Burkholderiales bacterium RIFCSPHIGHO2_12_63_9]OGB48460.1 MAG: hypothetical protein A3F76_05390 [Burkholderiales bacterium RIFCSPLOWO2_12_FULL_65_40]HCE27570.1 TetR/AcrR family transcriptional regulator [Comamonadaceae bacterium]NCU66834.1 TetR/AcrR family transcriptional regula